MDTFNEIAALEKYFKDHRIKVEILDEPVQHCRWVRLSINDSVWLILVDDEYGDLTNDNQLMALFLVFSSIQEYLDSTDFLHWCKAIQMDASNAELLAHYKELQTISAQINKELGSIDPKISQFDYSLNSGVAKALRNRKS